MKNKLTDLNDHLFMALERLNDETLTKEELEIELKRSDTISKVADVIVKNADTQLKAYKLASENGLNANVKCPNLIGCDND